MFSTLCREAESKSHLGQGPLLGEVEDKARRRKSFALLQEEISKGLWVKGGADGERSQGLWVKRGADRERSQGL